MSSFSASKPSTATSSPFASYRNSHAYYDFGSNASANYDFDRINLTQKVTNQVQRVINAEAYCFDVNKFSEKLIDATFIEANKLMSKEQDIHTIVDVVKPVLDTLIEKVVNFGSDDGKQSPMISGNSSSYYSKSISSTSFWPKVSEFNIKLGQEQISIYVQSWKRSSDWMYCIDFLGFESEDCSNVFVYEVEWSKPTKSYPIPQVTASVYFALEVYKMVPYGYDRNVDVSYVFEFSFLIHKPGNINFQEKWLQDIIDEKLKLFKKMVYSVSTSILQAKSFSF